MRKVEPGSTLSNKFWLCCSFFIKLTTCRATNLLVPEPINQSARCISSTRNKCFCCGSSNNNLLLGSFHHKRGFQKGPIKTKYAIYKQVEILQLDKLIAPGEKRETLTKTCSETMLRDKLRVFVSHISPPLTNRSQVVSVNGSHSSPRPVPSAVPPRLSIGTCFIFIIY